MSKKQSKSTNDQSHINDNFLSIEQDVTISDNFIESQEERYLEDLVPEDHESVRETAMSNLKEMKEFKIYQYFANYEKEFLTGKIDEGPNLLSNWQYFSFKLNLSVRELAESIYVLHREGFLVLSLSGEIVINPMFNYSCELEYYADAIINYSYIRAFEAYNLTEWYFSKGAAFDGLIDILSNFKSPFGDKVPYFIGDKYILYDRV